jgi:D-alanine-D-alanine ligase
LNGCDLDLLVMKKIIALVAGGYTGEYDISIKTALTIERNINPEHYTVYKIIIDQSNWLYTSPEGVAIPIDRTDFSLTLNGTKITFDAAFIAVHGTPGEDGKLQGYFEMIGMPFTTCDSVVSGLTFNKIFCNRVVASAGIVKVSKSVHVLQSDRISTDELLQQIQLPAFIKPAEGGSSLATTKVKTKEEIQPALVAVFAFDDQAMMEEFVKGREFSIGVYQYRSEIIALPVTEIISSKEFFDYEAKYTPGVTNEVTPAQIDPSLAQNIALAAKKIYRLLCCKGICRVDFIVEEGTHDIYFLEINTVPGQSEQSIVPQQVRACGLTLMDFYSRLIEEALA